MNADVAYRYRKRQAEVAELGEEAFRHHALRHLKLKTVIRESHVSPVRALAFNHRDSRGGNLFATVGSEQATVYDDLHMGDYVGVVVNLTNTATPHAAGGALQACAWLNSEGWTQHPYGDSLVAVAGEEGEVSVISVAEARVAFLLKGHSSPVVDLASCAARPSLLASLSSGGQIRTWDVEREECTATFQCAGATALVLDSEGTELIVAGAKNRLQSFRVPQGHPQGDQENAALGESAANRAPKSRAATKAEGEVLELKPGFEGKAVIDSLALLPGNRLVAKGGDGWVAIWDRGTGERLLSWRVPACTTAKGASCRFAATPGGELLAFGTDSGSVAVYETKEGKLIARTPPPKVGGPVTACGLSEDCRHVLVAAGNGFIFRFEYSRPEPKKAVEKEAEGGDIEMKEAE